MYLMAVVLGIIFALYVKNFYLFFLLSLGIFFIKAKKSRLIFLLFILSIFLTNIRIDNSSNFKGTIEGKVVLSKEDRFIVKTNKINNIKRHKKILFYGREKLGRILEIDGDFQRPLEDMNRGNFNNRLNFLSRGISYIGNVYHKEVLAESNIFYKFIENFTQRVKVNIYKNLDDKSARILSSILLSDKAFLEKEDFEDFSYFGISHILALSGFHIAILSIFLEKIFINLFSSRKISDFLSFVLIGVYIIALGFPIGAVRAFCFLFFYRIKFYLRLNIEGKEILQLTALLMLIVNPYALFSISFLLSYGAVLGIFYIYPKLIIYFPKENTINKSLALTSSVLIVIFPIINYYFSGVNSLVFLANLIIVPIYSIIIILGYLLALGISPLAFIISLLFKAIWGLEYLFYALPSFNLEIFGMNAIAMFLYYLILYFIITYRTNYRIYWVARKFFASYLAVLVFFNMINYCHEFNSFKETHFYIDQGDASLISYRNHNYLIDLGGAKRNNRIFENYLYPALKYRGIKKIDGIFISHFDEDHAGNLDKVLEKFRVKKIYSSYEDKIHRSILLKKGDHFKYKDLTFKVLGANKNAENANDKSLILLLKYRNKKILYTGDISSEEEKNIDENIDILKVAHHGSKSSTSLEFLNKTGPQIAIISCGINNSYGHPHGETIERLVQKNVKIFNTQNKEVDITINKNFLRVENYAKVYIDKAIIYNIIFALLLGVLLKNYELQRDLQER